jgi:large subunit ribosomal protein L22
MEIIHKTNNLRIAPRKLRLVADQVRHQDALKAMAILPLVTNKGGGIIYKSLKSALEVAKDNDLDPKTLKIQRIWCDEGRKLKRFVSKSHGQVRPIIKHSSHLSIALQGETHLKRKVKKEVEEEI